MFQLCFSKSAIMIVEDVGFYMEGRARPSWLFVIAILRSLVRRVERKGVLNQEMPSSPVVQIAAQSYGCWTIQSDYVGKR